MPHGISSKIHYIDIRAAVILRYSDLQYHLLYFNMIQGFEECGVVLGQSKYDDPVTISCQLWQSNLVTANKFQAFNYTISREYMKYYSIKVGKRCVVSLRG